MKNVFLNWEEFDKVIYETSRKLYQENFDGVYGIARGGLVMAVKLSHALGIPLLLYPTKQTLVVDDISDTGKTLQNIPNKMIVCWYTTPWTITKPDLSFGSKKDKDEWVIFPWEQL